MTVSTAWQAGVAHFLRSMGMDQVQGAKARKQAELEELIDAFVEALCDGASLWRGRTLPMDDLHDMPDEWDSLWEYSSER